MNVYTLLVIIALAFLGLRIVSTIVNYIPHLVAKLTGAPTITFNAFKSFYELNPDDWIELEAYYVTLQEAENNYKKRNDAYHQRIKCCFMDIERDSTSYAFKTYFDCVKYRRWNKKRKRQEFKQEIEKSKAEDIAWLIEQVQQNINAMEQQAESEVAEAAAMAIKAVRPNE